MGNRAVRNALALKGHHYGDRHGMLQKIVTDTPVRVTTELARPGYYVVYSLRDGTRMHLLRRALSFWKQDAETDDADDGTIAA